MKTKQPEPAEWEEEIQKDLDNGQFGMICSNEDTFNRNFNLYYMIQEIIKKLFCLHEYNSIEKFDFFIGIDLKPSIFKRVYCCKKCGKFKIITIK